MRVKPKIIIPVVAAVALLVVSAWYLSRRSIPVLQPAGPVGRQELHLIIFACLLAVVVVVPTFALTIFIAVKYREENHDRPGKNVKYMPDFDHSRLFESIWWGIPIVIIGVLSVVAWNSAHALDPYKPLASDKKQLTIQVVALDWKWLFIYPSQHLASVNLAAIPVGVPVDFHVTSDTIMNSFWVPQLGGQIYAMPGMDTQLHEQADKAGSYFGSPANIAGRGFSRMDFTVRAVSPTDFDAWVGQAKNASEQLDTQAYQHLARPSDNVPVTYYANVPDGFYDSVMMRYMMPMAGSSETNDAAPDSQTPSSSAMQGMDMSGMSM